LYYDRRHAGLGERFLVRPFQTRQRSVRRFPYGLIFREYDDHILIVAVAHFSRDPSFWHPRMPESKLDDASPEVS